MLDIRPNCEHCDRDLSPDDTEAMICSFECTFCRDCVEGILMNVCPNCGGGFEKRPVRPARAWRPGISLEHAPASGERIHAPVEPEQHAEFAAPIAAIDPSRR